MDRLGRYVTTLDLLCVWANSRCLVQRFCREVVTWNALRHPNVLPLLGVTMTENLFVVVSEWMVKGNINEFVKVNTKANRLELVRFSSIVLTFVRYS